MEDLLIGLNHLKDGEDYKVPGHFIEPIYVCPVDADWADYHSQRCAFIENLRYAGHKVIIKVKYRQNCDMPRTESELAQYLDVLQSAVLPRLHGGMGISFGNEPNWLPDPSDISTGNKPGWAAKVCAMSFELLDNAPQEQGPWEVWTTAIAPWSPMPGTIHGEIAHRVESSPWARYALEYYQKLDDYLIASKWAGVLLHTYANVGKDGSANGGAREPFNDVLDSHGWQWGTRTAVVWDAVLKQTWFKDSDVVIAEYNARAHGACSRDAYVAELFPNAVAALREIFGHRLKAVDWFIGDIHGGPIWNEETLYGEGRLRIARNDWERMQHSE